MTARAYILMKTSPGFTKAIYSSLRINPTVQTVETITGPYDLIVTLEGESTNEILAAVMREIRPAEGVRDTVTCLVVPGEELDPTN
ncbi:MAG: Lrp/AsnC ligand binding domain-containing protein [Anaerolineae bacterium]|jgi:DNA-binding Lrp family transcriptional regulator